MVAVGGQIKEILDTAVNRLHEALRPSAIYLYGSHAYGFPNSKSDLDLLVIVNDSSLSPFDRDAVAYRALGDLRFPIDVEVYTQDEFEDRAALPRSFEATVKQNGLRIDAA